MGSKGEAHGTTLTAGTSSFAPSYTRISTNDAWSREVIDLTDLDSTGAREKIASQLYNAGQIQVEGYFAPPEAGAPVAKTGATTQAENQQETWTIDFAGTGNTWACDGFLTNFDADLQLDGAMTFSATIELTGEWTTTEAA